MSESAMRGRYRRRPIEVQAEQYQGNDIRSLGPSVALLEMFRSSMKPGDWILTSMDGRRKWVCEAECFGELYERVPEVQCVQCDRWFKIGPGEARADKQTCSGACRTRRSRQRRKVPT